MSTISILNHKGGTGKTTTTLNLGKALTILGRKILLIDLDPQANLTQSLGLEGCEVTITELFSDKLKDVPILNIAPGFDLVPASLDLSAVEPLLYANINSYFKLKSFLDPIKASYDFILIDCPPSLAILTQNALISSDKVLITVQPQYLSLKGLDTVNGLINTVSERLNPGISLLGLAVTQSNNTKLSKETVAALNASFAGKVFKTTIRQNVAIAEASTFQKDIFSYNAESYGAFDYMSLAKEIV